MEDSKAPNAFKAVFMAFLVGGLLSVVGQVLLLLSAALLGADSPLVGPLTLILIGLFGLVTYVFGFYQKIMKVGGFGAIMPFCGLTAACAMTFSKVRAATGSFGKGAAAAAGLVGYVVGTASIVILAVTLIIVFAL